MSKEPNSLNELPCSKRANAGLAAELKSAPGAVLVVLMNALEIPEPTPKSNPALALQPSY